MKPKTIILLALIGVFGFFVVKSFGDTLQGYETFTEASTSGRDAHVAGTWLPTQPVAYDPGANTFTFTMADEDGTTRRVIYANPKPANFEDAEKVVVEGRMEGEVFMADNILVKCPSKYNEGNEFEQAEPGEAPTTTASL
ncbi:cytochrome c maturation protein CcmE [Rubricoccus marinus]|uniref:Cytochrome C biogenesis protein n=1 Tax=Rubricoccus marinus TaxID=716817 RepID=A0A259TVX5_9BACT|nr:cytochrome c maturation protein CcmE [Rubricoccus marinus]OZC01922.1 hypothetical protein BSZ36_02320 [Rubricoccus marinus]